MEEQENQQQSVNPDDEPAAEVAPELPVLEKIHLLAVPETEKNSSSTMEIHHHPHLQHEKLWKEYVFEFLMLFIAVSAGFFVENIREHYVEKHRAKEYAAMMVTDLKTDTIELNDIVHRTYLAVTYLDTFLQVTSKQEITQIPSGKLYWYGLWGGFIRPFISHDAALQQMKSSGTLRYITNDTLAKLITDYDLLLRSMQELNDLDAPIYLETRKARAKIFDFRYNLKANEIAQATYVSFNQSIIDTFMLLNPPMLTVDKGTFNEYIELCRSRMLKAVLKKELEILEKATNLLGELKKVYHFD
ncbi:MAG: hypothetical protein C5B52_00915 [Bacteroidetes bacterium]|nr:MAG: hypothetical protein C5B52_00915 [Bacteroidota bacterium]